VIGTITHDNRGVVIEIELDGVRWTPEALRERLALAERIAAAAVPWGAHSATLGELLCAWRAE